MKRRLAVLTSGGDAPGMNAAIRSVVRVGTARGLEVVGIRRGYKGLLTGDMFTLSPRDVSNIIQRGGTILKTSRCEEFKTPEGRQKAKAILEQHKIDGLILIGGDGTFRGGDALGKIWSGQIIGVPGTIDNDVYGTDYTIGYDTAINTALDAIDKIRDTADSHDRIFVVEVMGRHSGFIAQAVGVCGGAEEILVPEEPFDLAEVARRIREGRQRGKTSSIIIVAEGEETGGAVKVAQQLAPLAGYDMRVVILGYLQRGGTPTAADRLLATKLGAYAVDLFIQGATGVMAGEVGGILCATPLTETWSKKKPLDKYLTGLQQQLAS
ncbi:MAG: 6-phosphofructokinase [Verrucomicrobiales bacterium]|nr:6-phosphofructokinase [Verrucomicrobiales bacterium]